MSPHLRIRQPIPQGVYTLFGRSVFTNEPTTPAEAIRYRILGLRLLQLPRLGGHHVPLAPQTSVLE